MAITVQMRTEVSQLYVALFGRAPDGEGLGFWVGLRDQGRTLAQLADMMYATTPARTYFPSFLTNGEIIASFYSNVLGRAADAEGLAFWTGKLNAAGATPGSVIAEMITIVANYTGSDAAGKDSQSLFNNRVQVAQYYGEKNGSVTGATTVLSTVTKDAATVTSTKSSIDGGTVGGVNQGSTFTLTTAIDNFTGTSGNDTFIGDNNTVTGADQMNGGAGTDTFRFFSNTATVPTLNGVEQVDLVNSGADIDLSSVSSLTLASIENNPTAARAVMVGANVTVQAKNVTNNANALTFTGTASQTSMSAVLSGSSDVGTLNLDGAAITTLNIQATGTANNKVATLASTGPEATLNVTGDKGLTITNALAATVATVNASALTGSLSVDVSAAAGSALTNLKVTGGTGGDTVKLGAMALGVNAAIDGGAGTDTVQITDGSKITTTTGKQITNFETLATGAGTGTYDASLISGITAIVVDGDLAGNTSITNLPAAPTVTINKTQTGAETLTVALKTASGTSDEVTFAIGGSADVSTTGKLITSAIETVKLVSTKAASNASTAGNTISDLDVTNAKTIEVSGSYKLTVTATSNTGSVTKVDAGAATGAFVMGGKLATTSSVLYVGGSAGDTFLGNATGGTSGDTMKGGKGGDTLTLAAAGKSDILLYTAASDSQITATSATGMDTVTNFTVGEDDIDLTTFAFSGFAAGVKSVGTITNPTTTVTRTDLFDVAGSDRSVAFGDDATDTYVFIDVNKDGNYTAADDLIIKLAGLKTLSASDFVF